MGIRNWRHRGQEKIVLSKKWPDGTRFRRFMPNKTVAKELETDINYAIAKGLWPDLKDNLARGIQRNSLSPDPTIGDFESEYLSHCSRINRRPDFKEQALKSIVKILGGVRLSELKRRHGDLFTEKRTQEGLSAATINRGIAVLRHMASVAVEREYIKTNPFSKFRMLPEIEKSLRVLTYDEYRHLIQAVAEIDSVVGAYLVMFGETGMRKSEGLRLRWDDIHQTGSGRYKVIMGTTKGGKVRSVPLSELALKWLNGLIRFIGERHVFVDPVTRKAWKDPRGPFFKGRKTVGLDWVGFHDLRHFRATQWLIKGVDVVTVKELLGHSDVQTTMRYLHYVQSHANESVLKAQQQEVAEWTG